ncbi:DUF4124 domain-containing protein [Shewanella septentrionalis]|uniref:DUF4124 domain-containing protein n=1 Tax=Shewanella septentrionalis TaxID=2952223 RepID=A0A9X2WR55_9GAMM|nr:DUF4124 domain-containing protein [Shewanella septentrionalis]MCT7944061.1 DUF4124 domain-containing protein [Shewanella septentrionalis]
MIKWILLTSLMALLSTNANAEIYRCTVDGVDTYSQTPCAEDAQPIIVTPPAKLHSGENTLNEDELVSQCVEVLKRYAGFKDPDSIKVEGHFFDWQQDDSGARRVLQLKINAKNSFGAYDGGKYRPCFLSYNGTKVSENQKLIFK